ncbi:MAG TPA: hypothetical protein VGK56_15040 [Anaerolineales bacterium]
MRNVSDLVRKASSLPWLPAFLTIAGFLVYLVRAVEIARTKTSFLDEGLYLYKGYLFATGQQLPFADYGVWTNHAILSFLIPGYVQKWFGPGLETGRYFMIFLSLFTLLGLWVFARRWGNAWWAAGTVWVMALNPAEIKIHTLAISEGLVAALLVWIIVLIVGERRPLWQILLGAALMAPLVLTRENMAFVPPIVLVYIFWQHGWKAGLLASLCAGVLFLAGNALYFPDNLKFWAMRLPDVPFTFLRDWRIPETGGTSLPEPEESNLYRMILYFWLTLRLHFVALVSALVVWLLLPFRIVWPIPERMRAVGLLSVLLVVLYVAHVQAAFFGEFCISCILLYIGYFDFLGLMMLVIAAPMFVTQLTPLRQIIVFAVIALLILGVGFSSHEDLSADFAKAMMERLDGTYLWGTLIHRIDLPHLVLFRVAFVLLVSVLVIVAGALALGIIRRRLNGGEDVRPKLAILALHGLLILGLILSPTKVLGAGNDFFDCGDTNVFVSYQEAGEELSQVIEPGSKIYWEGRLLAIFLYLPDVKIYPPQMNHVHSYFIGGDADTLLRYSQWNDELARQWLEEADYILFQNTERVYLTDEMLESGEYVKVMSAPRAERCRWQSVIQVYQRADVISSR